MSDHRAIGLLALLLISAPLQAQQVFRCVGADGKTSFQDSPCGSGQQQSLQSTAPQPSGASPEDHYQRYLDLMSQDKTQQSSGNPQAAAQPNPAHTDVFNNDNDRRRSQCDADQRVDTLRNNYATFSCDAQGNHIPVPPPPHVYIVPGSGRSVSENQHFVDGGRECWFVNGVEHCL